jgi:outer membrane biosynthesis protein TonB
LTIGAALLVAAGQAAAFEPPARSVVFKTDRQFRALGGPGPYFPDQAARNGVSGAVVIDCKVTASSRLEQCALVSMTPAGMSFDFAALKMAQVGWMTAGEVPTGTPAPDDGVWRFRVEFQAPRRYP